MIDYRAGAWGFRVALGWSGSLAPRALTMAIPNAILTFVIATFLRDPEGDDFSEINEVHKDTSAAAQLVIASFTSVMIFILYNRSNTAYDRWWEGGTLLQKTRGEWFNAYSSIMAFTSSKPELQAEVDSYCHLLARLMSLLMCCGLQQVSPNRDRPFEIIDLSGIQPSSMEFLNSVPDKVETILQWIQRSMVIHAQTGVLPVPPPILSRAFQEVSRGIVNLQNARKIADFPYPYPLEQVSMILQLLHWAMIPIGASLAAPRSWAVLFSFFSIFVLWCIHFNALDLEFPFGDRVNDLPMHEMQQEWNKSIYTLLDRRATRPPHFGYDADVHDELYMVMSDASDLYVPSMPVMDKGSAIIRVGRHGSEANGGDQNADPGAGHKAASKGRAPRQSMMVKVGNSSGSVLANDGADLLANNSAVDSCPTERKVTLNSRSSHRSATGSISIKGAAPAGFGFGANVGLLGRDPQGAIPTEEPPKNPTVSCVKPTDSDTADDIQFSFHV
jgi:predicted membrane chloride channel (bestrophin family)